MMSDIVTLMRPAQWVKNLFVLLPLFFGGKITQTVPLLNSLLLLVAFSLMASAVYCINDIADIDADRLHPVKQNRPLAAGRISRKRAIIIAVTLMTLAMVIPLGAGVEIWIRTAWILAFYLVLNVLYTFKLKNISIVDVFIVAFGFVLRVACGGEAAGIWVSPWLMIMTFLLTLFIVLAKRRDDVLLLKSRNIETRKNIKGYNLRFLDSSLVLVSAIMMVSYLLYTLSPEVVSRLGCDYLYISAIFVLAGMLRYMQLAMVDEKSGSPTGIIYHDRFMQLCVVLWVIFFIVIIYVR